MMAKLEDLTIKSFREGLDNKEFSASEVVKSLFEYIDLRTRR